ncbi:hypothetical protein MNV49_006595 [Pseudohyphozyma bogoriensis]|nr:hypothetical protein MNV49_006595 [Pseudohyphozyma bogoriensis]
MQDDFAPPAELIPIHPIHKIQDWDDPELGAIQFDRQRDVLKHIKASGVLPDDHASHDALNAEKLDPVPVSEDVVAKWKTKFEELGKEHEVAYVILDGFLIFWDDESVKEYDVRVFVREGYDVLKKRRNERHGYHTAEGSLWRDPPDYWDNIVWPAYLKAHRPIFIDGNVESGQPDHSKVDGLVVYEASELGMDAMLEKTCEEVYESVVKGKTAKEWKRP